MKKLFVLFSAILVLVLTGCRTSDEALIDPTESNSIGQSWSLNKISGGLAGVSITYPYGQVVWTFNENTNELMVVNNITTTGVEYAYSGHDTGTYSYEIVVNNGDSMLFINNQQRGIISISNTGLNIDDGVAADGMLTEFEQVNP